MSKRFSAVLDTCVLVPSTLRDVLLTAAEEGFYKPLWSFDILSELKRTIIRVAGCTDGQVSHLCEQMEQAFPEALVSDYETLIPAMTNNVKDRHVLAAAVCSGAEVIVTGNLRDFPLSATSPHRVSAVSPDAFLSDLLDLDPERFCGMLVSLARERRGGSIEILLARLSPLVPGCTRLAAFHLDIPTPG
jgi:predicted nucleic acid-binding protein